MAKKVHDEVLDGALNVISGATSMVALATEPVDRAAATSGKLAEATLSAADFVKSDGAVNGRRITIAEKTGVPVTANGTATHIALVDATRLLYVTTCASQALTQGGTVRFGTWEVELADPA